MTDRRILVIDDDHETCRLIAELIAAPDREIRELTSAREALALARSEPFDLVISDINLNAPESGIDLLKTFKAARVGGVKNYFVEQNWELTQPSVAYLKTLKV